MRITGNLPALPCQLVGRERSPHRVGRTSTGPHFATRNKMLVGAPTGSLFRHTGIATSPVQLYPPMWQPCAPQHFPWAEDLREACHPLQISSLGALRSPCGLLHVTICVFPGQRRGDGLPAAPDRDYLVPIEMCVVYTSRLLTFAPMGCRCPQSVSGSSRTSTALLM